MSEHRIWVTSWISQEAKCSYIIIETFKNTRTDHTYLQRSLIFLSPPLGFVWACQVTSSLPVHIYIVLCMLPTECRVVFCKLCRNCVNCRSNQVKWLLSFQAKFTCSLIIHLIIWKNGAIRLKSLHVLWADHNCPKKTSKPGKSR